MRAYNPVIPLERLEIYVELLFAALLVWCPSTVECPSSQALHVVRCKAHIKIRSVVIDEVLRLLFGIYLLRLQDRFLVLVLILVKQMDGYFISATRTVHKQSQAVVGFLRMPCSDCVRHVYLLPAEFFH